MSNIYIEQNPNGDYEVKERGNPNPIAVAPTQRQAEEKAHQLYPNVRPDVERVKHTDKGEPDKWRKADNLPKQDKPPTQ
jgi:hypothetical protein